MGKVKKNEAGHGDVAPYVPRGIAHIAVDFDGTAHVFIFALAPHFSMLSFVAAVEPLRMANQLSGKSLFRWETRSEDGEAVKSSNGLSVSSDGVFDAVPAGATVLACSGNYPDEMITMGLAGFLREKWRKGHQVGSLCTGAYALAKAGILKGHEFTMHWENQKTFIEDQPGFRPSDRIYVIDRRIMSCGGGAASTDMMLDLIRSRFGATLARGVADMCLHLGSRSSEQRQRTPASLIYGTHNKTLLAVLDYIADNLAEEIDLEQLAATHQVSRRHVERLFSKHVGTPPNRYINELRLEHGRALLTETALKVTDVALASGFASPNHFSKLFRRRYGMSPQHYQSGAGGSGKDPLKPFG
ncbi:GlxA family transcriptional regulator [Candidatus Halocynthiibacter alkanivorans]|uniref:GlxA family transcriptional regulator n=1 Tax=Candidatus Halocynthiibacter alkanivorans TaxID=2267619 RepID=UPI00135876BB|nr:GlxA family transcriptional regulator [Candidatus Halocynthiibacter alkanivorans]